MERFKKIYGIYRSLLWSAVGTLVTSFAISFFGKPDWGGMVGACVIIMLIGLFVFRIILFLIYTKISADPKATWKEIKTEYKTFFNENIQAMKEKRPYVSPYQTKAGLIAFVIVMALGYFSGQGAPKGGVATNSTSAPMQSQGSSAAAISQKFASAMSASSWVPQFQNKSGNMSSWEKTSQGVERNIAILDLGTYIDVALSTAGSAANSEAIFTDFGTGTAAIYMVYPEDKASLQKLAADMPKYIDTLTKTKEPIEAKIGNINFSASISEQAGDVSFTLQASKQVRK